MHRAEQLNILARNRKAARNPRLHQLDTELRRPLRIVRPEQKEVLCRRVVNRRHLPAVDAVRVGDDVAVGGLAEDKRQA